MALSPGSQLLNCKQKTERCHLWGNRGPPSTLWDDTHLPPTAEAGHSVPLAQVVESCLGELCGSYDGECPGLEGVQAVLLSAHVGIMTCWSLVGHVLYTTRTKRAWGWRGREAHVQVANWLFALVCWWVGNSWTCTGKLQIEAGKKNHIILKNK